MVPMTLPPPQEGVVTMSTEAWQRLNAQAKPLPKSDESDSGGPQDRRLRQSMFMQGYHSADYFSGISDDSADGKVANPPKKEMKVNRRKGNRVLKRVRHDVKMLYKRVEKLEEDKDAVWKKGYSKGCKVMHLHGTRSSSSVADVQPAPKGKSKGKGQPTPKGSVASRKPRQFSR
jgi:hypothetical protein